MRYDHDSSEQCSRCSGGWSALNTKTHKILFISENAHSAELTSKWSHQAEIVPFQKGDRERIKEELSSVSYAACVIRSQEVSEAEFELLQLVRTQSPATRVIVSVRSGSVEDAVRYMKAGASDFQVGDTVETMLEHSISRLLPKRVSEHLGLVSSDVRQEGEEILLLSKNPKILGVLGAIKLVAKSKTAVLITGESGTGKELVARMIHRQSDRDQKRFVALNCAAIPRDLVENELFGHEQGAFELANGGSLFLDKIEEINAGVQAKLLRAIDRQAIRKLGGSEEVPIDVRLLAATSKNISAMKDGEFQKDLYYRFSVIEIYLPPLRERKEDIPLLLDHFLHFFGERYRKAPQRFLEECVEMLMEYNWPGNIRELRNIVERCVVTCPQHVISFSYVSRLVKQEKGAQSYITIPLGSSAREAERKLILETLAAVNENKSRAARILGLSRKTILNKLHAFEEVERESLPGEVGG